MFRVCARDYHSYTHLLLALGIVSEPTVWKFITSKYPGIHVIGLPTVTHATNKIVAELSRFITRLWDKYTMPCADAKSFRWGFSAKQCHDLGLSS